MKNINIHKVDITEIIEENFDWLNRKIERHLSMIDKSFKYLYFVYRDGIELIQINSVINVPDMELNKYFQYSIMCMGEVCRLAHFENKFKEVNIKENKFLIKVEGLNEIRGIRKALQISRIYRNKDIEKNIALYPKGLLDLDNTKTLSHRYLKRLLILEIEYSLTGSFNEELFCFLENLVQTNEHNIKPHINRNVSHNLYYIHPYLKAFQSLVKDNNEEFNKNLEIALIAHKKVWSQKKALNRGGNPLNRESDGFISWDCTVLASMAYDRGWKLEVSSDYMPISMINGTINL